MFPHSSVKSGTTFVNQLSILFHESALRFYGGVGKHHVATQNACYPTLQIDPLLLLDLVSKFFVAKKKAVGVSSVVNRSSRRFEYKNTQNCTKDDQQGVFLENTGQPLHITSFDETWSEAALLFSYEVRPSLSVFAHSSSDTPRPAREPSGPPPS